MKILPTPAHILLESSNWVLITLNHEQPWNACDTNKPVFDHKNIPQNIKKSSQWLAIADWLNIMQNLNQTH